MSGSEIDWSEVQTIVGDGYSRFPYTRYFLLKIIDGAATREWLRRELHCDALAFGESLAERCGNGDVEKTAVANIAFTFEGLKKIGLPCDTTDTFPWEFRDGMTSPLRQKILRDIDYNSPDKWKWGGPGQEPIHILVIAYSKTADDLNTLSKLLHDRWEGALKIVSELSYDHHDDKFDGKLAKDRREHFGFVDGLSQPAIESSKRSQKLRARGDFDDIVKPGEFLLGYVNERGQLPTSPTAAYVEGSKLRVISELGKNAPRLDFGRNGSFLVYRQLEQNVCALAKLLDAASKIEPPKTQRCDDETDVRRWIAAKIVGRWDNGVSLTLAPNKPPEDAELKSVNNFGYAAEDRYGLRCPIGSHARRSFPRDGHDGSDPGDALRRNKRHRLLRRGRIYGERTFGEDGEADGEKGWKAWEGAEKKSDGVERGLHFVAINANIESQFEFIQQTWMNTSFFGGLLGEVDPFVGVPDPGEPRRFTIQSAPINRRLSWTKDDAEPLVTVRGGAYFFLPSFAALSFLSDEKMMSALADKTDSKSEAVREETPS